MSKDLTNKTEQLTPMQEANMLAASEQGLLRQVANERKAPPGSVQAQIDEIAPLHQQRMEKLMVLADAIESISIDEDGSLHLKTKNHLVIESEGHQVFHSKDGQVVLKHQKIHLNPPTTVVSDTDEYVKQIESDIEEQITRTNEDCDCE